MRTQIKESNNPEKDSNCTNPASTPWFVQFEKRKGNDCSPLSTDVIVRQAVCSHFSSFYFKMRFLHNSISSNRSGRLLLCATGSVWIICCTSNLKCSSFFLLCSHLGLQMSSFTDSSLWWMTADRRRHGRRLNQPWLFGWVFTPLIHPCPDLSERNRGSSDRPH